MNRMDKQTLQLLNPVTHYIVRKPLETVRRLCDVDEHRTRIWKRRNEICIFERLG